MEAVIAPEEKRISLEGEKRGVCDTAMYLAEEQASRRASSFFFFSTCRPFRGKDCSVSFKVPYIWCLLAAERANPAVLC